MIGFRSRLKKQVMQQSREVFDSLLDIHRESLPVIMPRAPAGYCARANRHGRVVGTQNSGLDCINFDAALVDLEERLLRLLNACVSKCLVRKLLSPMNRL